MFICCFVGSFFSCVFFYFLDLFLLLCFFNVFFLELFLICHVVCIVFVVVKILRVSRVRRTHPLRVLGVLMGFLVCACFP